jgi:hypothetical protein
LELKWEPDADVGLVSWTARPALPLLVFEKPQLFGKLLIVPHSSSSEHCGRQRRDPALHWQEVTVVYRPWLLSSTHRRTHRPDLLTATP